MIEPSSGSVLVLNDVGGEVWDLISSPRRLSDIVTALGRCFTDGSTGDSRLESDVSEFIELLAENSLLADVADGGDLVIDSDRDVPIARAYSPPAIIFAKQIEAVAASCAFDPPLTKAGGGDGCTGLTFS